MIHTFRYKSGVIHETVENGVSEVRWQLGGVPGRVHQARSVHAAKCAITRRENAQKGEG